MTKARDIADNAGQGGGGGKNVIINGAMNVAQRATSATGLGGGSGYYTVDRYKTQTVGTTAGRYTMEQAGISDLAGFHNCIKLSCTTADTSIGGSESLLFRQIIEGQDLQRFAKGTSDAKEFTVSFYVKGNANATYTCELFDSDNSRQISKTFSVTTSWTRVILTFPADTTGAFTDDNGVSLYVTIWLVAGPTYSSGTLNSSAWAAQNVANRASGSQTNFFDSTSRTLFVTGLQLEVGDKATDFEHRSFADELHKCQRYYAKTYDYGVFVGHSGDDYDGTMVQRSPQSTSSNQLGEPFPVRMRAMPTVTFYGPTPATSAAGKIRGSGNAVITATLGSNTSERVVYVSFTSNQAASYISAHYTADAEL